ncbi:MAG: ATP-dependent DNA helicase [Alphaproteobacteria bacterium]|nr:ATP-dependent DNA helicase [Alphaproteobacteria bacterium]
MSSAPPPAPRLEADALVVGRRVAKLFTTDGELRDIGHDDARALVRAGPVLICHRMATARRLGIDPFPAFDLLELFAFARPATFCLPTGRGLAAALGLPLPLSLDDEPTTLATAAERLLAELAATPEAAAEPAAGIARVMAAGGWPWGAPVLEALAAPAGGRAETRSLAVWERLPAWEEQAPPAPPEDYPVSPDAARARLGDLLGGDAEARPQQVDYAMAVSDAFQPRAEADAPNFVLAEAGTGVGKTLGYVAPASLWAERNGGTVWFSTYTRNLQHQIDRELDRLCADPEDKARRIVLRKGRENYFCLLNMEDRVRSLAARPGDAVALGLMARWAAASHDGDMTGGDFPAWLGDLLGPGLTTGLADRRGECIYSACSHYGKCFIEHTVRRARRADIVVANHALVMIQAALGGGEDMRRTTRFVFDEGHHLFDAADSAFSAHLSASETAELRRWLVGGETRRRSRARGLERRIGDIVAADDDGREALEKVVRGARALPAESWRQRLIDGRAVGPAEAFLAEVRRLVYARVPNDSSPYGLEADARPADAPLLAAAAALDDALAHLLTPVKALAQSLADRLDGDAARLDSATRMRIEAVVRGLKQRGILQIEAWRRMLAELAEEPADTVVDWLAVDRYEGRDFDVGMHRHWVDPMAPFAEFVARPAHGIVVTSATLRDGTGDADADWQAADLRSGAAHLGAPTATRIAVPSPFNYIAHTRIFVVTDVRKDDMDQVAAAYRTLIEAARGGALGLFTAITRLRAVHKRIADPLDEAGLTLLAQHVDPLNTATLVEMFRAEPDASLLGTDAVRDGVDVPGEALRLIVFDRVPWPRPTILHRVRRTAFGGRGYDDMTTRLRLKQAYGRLIRRNQDRGVFVLLDPMMPSRLYGAFPEGVEVHRVGLAAAAAETRIFLEGDGPVTG